MALETFLPICTEILKDPIKNIVVSTKRHICYAFTCDSNVDKLRQDAEELNSKRSRMQISVDTATRNGEQIHEDVTKWLTSVDRTIEEAQELITGKEEAMKKRCFIGFCPNLVTRYQLSRRAEKKASAIRDAKGKQPSCFRAVENSISYPPASEQMIAAPIYSREALPSRVSMLKDVMDVLKDPELNMIGVYGMGGVGKTTLAKEVQRQAQVDKLFDAVVFVAVSQSPEILRIQKEIAEVLNLNLKEEGLLTRAYKLSERLKKEKKILIILDDVWKQLKLEDVGIPFGDDCKGCKILLTSRSKDVLSREMSTQKELKLDVLPEEEAQSLFQMTTAEAKDPNLLSIATEIANKCGGLPLLLLKVAKDLQKRESYTWRVMLDRLSAFDDEEIQRKVHSVLESSYENLPDNEVKSFFLLCGLFGQSNIRIRPLIRYSMGLGLFRHATSIQQARDKVRTVIDKLKDECLLLDGDMDGFVKMHDIVRDTALTVAFREQHAFVRLSGYGERAEPNKDCTRISLPYCDGEMLPEVLECPKAEILLLFTEDFSLKICDSYFKGMRKLKVVDLTGMHFASLPSSLGLAANIHTLCLHRCQLDAEIAIIGKLKQLQILSFADSYIVELPREIEQLGQLKLLDLSNCSKLEVLPANVLSKLTKLEELYMRKSFIRWERICNGQKNASVGELEELHHLTTLALAVPNPEVLQKFVLSNVLEKYWISIGERMYHRNGGGAFSKALLLNGSIIDLGHGLRDMLREAEYLELESIGNGFSDGEVAAGSFSRLTILKVGDSGSLTNLLSIDVARCLSQLKVLEVADCREMEYIVVDGEGEDNNEMVEFTQLVSLELWDLPNLRSFCEGKKECRADPAISKDASLSLFNTTKVSFPKLEVLHLSSINCRKIWEDHQHQLSNLTILNVWCCKNLKHLFGVALIKSLSHLKSLSVSHCESIEEIMLTEEIESVLIVFPKLDSLFLYWLPQLRRFCSGYSIEFRSLRKLEINNCNDLTSFAVPNNGGGGADIELQQEDDSETTIHSLFNHMVAFPNLEDIDLCDLRSLKYIWYNQLGDDDSFSKLKSLTINGCSKLLTIFPLNGLRRFQKLEKLRLEECSSMQEIFQVQQVNDATVESNMIAFELKDVNINNLSSLKYLWSKNSQEVFTFEKLQSLSISYCMDLKYIFPSSIAIYLLRLEKLEIVECGVLEIIAEEECKQQSIHSFQFPQLFSVKFSNLQKLKSFYPRIRVKLPNLKCAEVHGCRSLSNGQPIFEVDKVKNRLEEVTFEGKDLMMMERSVFPVEKLSKLKVVRLMSLHHKCLHFLKRLHRVDTLAVHKGSVQVLFSHEGVGEEQLVHVKHLELYDLHNLKHIWKWNRHSPLNPHLLHSLRVSNCPSLINIAPSSSSFQNLSSLYMIDCHRLKNLLTASTAKTMVNLTEITVHNCKEMTEIVARDGDAVAAEDEIIIVFNKLKSLNLFSLSTLTYFSSAVNHTFNFPSLEQVSLVSCKRMITFCGGPLSTPKLRGINSKLKRLWEGNLNATITSRLTKWVMDECGSSTAIPTDKLHLLKKLGTIEVKGCESVKQVFDLEGLSADDGLLHQLRELRLINLPKLTHLCNKNPHGILDFKYLWFLELENCGSLKYAFTQSMVLCLSKLEMLELKSCRMMEGLIEAAAESDNCIVFPELQSVYLENLPKFLSFYSGSGNLECPSLTKISIHDCPKLKMQSFFSILNEREDQKQGFHNFKEMSLDSRSIMILQSELATAVQVLDLHSFPNKSCVNSIPRLINLKWVRVCDSSSSSLKEIFKGLDGVQIKLESLEVYECHGLISVAPSSISFQALTILKVDNCNGLINLVTSTVAKSMLHLVELTVQYCNNLTEIVAGEEDGTTDEIVFTNLKRLNLCDLQSLTSFCLGNHSFTFPCLEQVTLEIIPNLRTFCLGLLTAPKLQSVILTIDYSEDIPQFEDYWAGDLNATIKQLHVKMVGFRCLKDLKLSQFVELKEKWHDQFSFSFLQNLTKLVVDDCGLFSGAIPSNVLQAVNKLKVLIVEKCESLEKVFDLNSLNADEGDIGLMEQLNELHLIDLPRLRNVWNKDPGGILNFENLTLLKVHDCGKLTNIFTLSVALDLANLQQLEVKRCISVEHIITKEAEEEEIASMWDKAIFPFLHSISLECLPSLSSFYSEGDVLKCPSLTKLDVVLCPKIELFASTFSNEDVMMFSGKVAIPNFEKLKVEWNMVKHMLNENFQVFLQRLKVIEVTCFPGESAHLPSHFIQSFPSLEKLILSDAFSEETILHELKHPVVEDPLIVTDFKNLETLQVLECSRMKVLISSSVSFQSLTTLEVSKCHGLMNLMTASVARSLEQLRRMNIKECEMVQEIVESEADAPKAEIEFSKLKCLTLHALPSLKSFCSGPYAFNFPSLEEVIVRECPSMKTFAQGVLATQKLWRIQTREFEYEWEWEGDLNKTIEALSIPGNDVVRRATAAIECKANWE